MGWRLCFRGLDDTEMNAVANLFQSTRGSHDSFVFLDPEGNLLSESEDYSAAAWLKSPGMVLSTALSAPQVANAATRITSSGSSGELSQRVELPCEYRWLLSAYVRADVTTSTVLFLRSAHGEVSRAITPTAEWERYSYGGSFWPSGTGFEVGIRSAPNSTVDVSAFQLEAQLAPSGYKRTAAISGVYPKAHFNQDSLRVTTLAPNCHQLNLKITATISG